MRNQVSSAPVAWVRRLMATLLRGHRACFIWLSLCVMLALTQFACASRYSTEALQAMAPGADIVQVCVRTPNVGTGAIVWAFNQQSRITASDEHWDNFERVAETAHVLYRYDPDAPENSAERLPWPYQTMSCRTLSSTKTVPLPKELREVQVSPALREALVAALIEMPSETLRVASNAHEPMSPGEGRRFTGQFVVGGGQALDRRSPQERIEAVGQILRDAVRWAMPKISSGGPKDEQISLIDTETGQVIGGLGAGATIGAVPGGVFMADAVMNSDKLPSPTPQFRQGEALGEMGMGLFQMGAGTTMGAAGVGASGTGGGAVVGVPMCVAGITLAANGAVTFLHGAKSLWIAICYEPALADAQPLAATTLQDPSSPSAPAANTPSTSAPTTTPAQPATPSAAPAKPTPAPVQAAKPVPPVKPAPPVKPIPAAKPTDPTVVTILPSGTTTTTRPRLKPGEKPSDTTLTVHTDEAGKVQSMTVEVQAAELKPYNQGGGHHTPAKRAFEGAPNYDSKKALAVPNAELQRLGVDHDKITQSQRKAYIDLSKTGASLTWDAVAKIEVDALVKGEMKLETAKATVAKAIQVLKDSGVPGPMRIPWGK